MSTTTLRLTPHDPIIARDGRPFGAGQGNRMHGMAWPLPSVVAGSFRTALVKANPNLDFRNNMPQRLMDIAVAGAFPTVGDQLYLPAPSNAVAEPDEDGKSIKMVHRVTPQDNFGGSDFPDDLPLQPVMLSEEQAVADFKPADVPAWWPIKAVSRWLLAEDVTFDKTFLGAAIQETRDHVHLDPDQGAAAEGKLFTTSGLAVTHLPRFGMENAATFEERLAKITLSVRVAIVDDAFEHVESLSAWHPLGGERRLVHWRRSEFDDAWACPPDLAEALNDAPKNNICMVLATPAIFRHGWRPGWLDAGSLTGEPWEGGPMLRLVGVANGRWKAVSGWSLAPPRGPKPIRRMVPAGSVYFFEKVDGGGFPAADGWLRPISDDEQDQRDGFGLALWGTW